MSLKFQKAFTFIEVLVAIAILGVISSAVIVAVDPDVRGDQARDAVRKQDLDVIRHALVTYHFSVGTLPNPGPDLASGSNESSWLSELKPDYLKTIPKDPRQANVLSRLAGIFDGSDGRVAAAVVPDKNKTYQMKVLVLNYMPPSGSNLDYNITGIVSTLNAMRNKVNTIKNETLQALEEGSKYRGTGPVNMDYSIIREREYLEALPLGQSLGGGLYHPDYMQILNRENICDLVDNQGLKEVWLFGYHYGNIVPVESNMSGPNGDISNSNRSNDMPICSKTYVLYNYNYGRGSNEATHNHGHQIESVMAHFDQVTWDKFAGPWKTYTTSDGSPQNPHRCGWTHSPPNAGEPQYIYNSSHYVWTDCDDWRPNGFGNATFINCTRWQCDERRFHIWRWQNIPGYNNQLLGVTNWWDFIGDFDAVTQNGQKLIYDLNPPSTPTGLNASNVLGDRVTLGWNASSDDFAVSGYEIKRDGAFIGTTSTTSFVDYTVLPNTQYQYTVAAVDSSQNVSAHSGSVSVTTGGTLTGNPTRPLIDSTSGKIGGPSQIKYSFLHSIGNGPNRFLVVAVAIRHSNSNSVSTVKFRGADLYRIGFRDSGGLRTEIWGFKNPPAGIGEIEVTLSKVPMGGATMAGASSWFYVDQTSSTGTFASASGFSNNPTLNVPSTINTVVVDTAAMPSNGWVASGAGLGQTIIWNNWTWGDTLTMGSYKDGITGTTNVSWSTNREAWNISGVSLNLGIPQDPIPDPTPVSDPTPDAEPDPNAAEGCPESVNNYCYVVNADFGGFMLWAHLENENDPLIWSKPMAACKLNPPNEEFYNYCVRY